MRIDEVDSYDKLLTYVKLELARQTVKNHTVELELPEKWFFKFARYIQFALKHDKKEKYCQEGFDISEDCKKYLVKINRIFTVVKRK